MNKKFFVSILLALMIFVPVTASSQNLGLDRARNAAITGGFDPNTSDTSFSQTIGRVVRAALTFIGVIFTALMVYAGFMWMTARGEEDKIKKSQNIIKASIIGLIITLGAYSITAFVVPRLLERTGAGGAPTTQGN